MNILKAKQIKMREISELSDYGFVLRRSKDKHIKCELTKLENVSGVFLIGFTSTTEDKRDIPVYAEQSIRENIYSISYNLLNENNVLRVKFDAPLAIKLSNNKWFGFMVKQLYSSTGVTLDYHTYIIKETANTKIIYEED